MKRDRRLPHIQSSARNIQIANGCGRAGIVKATTHIQRGRGGGVIPVQNAGKEGRGSVRIATMNGCLRVAPTEEEEEGRTSSMCKWPAARQPTIEVF